MDYNGCKKTKEIERLRCLNDPRIIIIEGDYLGDFLTLADELMPNFMNTSSDDKVAETLNNLLSSKIDGDDK